MNSMSRLRVVVMGWLIRGPAGGIAWHYLNYVLGLAELGHDVYYVEDSGDAPVCYDADLMTRSADSSYGLRFASNAFEQLGLLEVPKRSRKKLRGLGWHLADRCGGQRPAGISGVHQCVEG
jgi:hypothetical protein